MSACIHCGGIHVDPHVSKWDDWKDHPKDPCTCGHLRKQHHTNGCDMINTEDDGLPCSCAGFELDTDKIESDAKADAENRAYDESKE